VRGSVRPRDALRKQVLMGGSIAAP
jgi:hypothetical protein